ncbi:alpha/beta hydrolase family protein [Dactylosporangium sp. CA-233914]|uniref:alpha/beta hydrolase family protein n=1 Tax=Dactylosporangium sp. CA-233914 TaxID=3239934 RepID=UPI003D8B7B67
MAAFRLTRRGALQGALAAAVAAPIDLSGPRRLRLPGPTGPYPVGTVVRHLARRPRELMVSVWYPARETGRFPLAQWLSAAVTRELLVHSGFPAGAVTAPLTAGRVGAPALRSGGPWPVVLFSHGAHDHRADTTITVQELASHGYVVVTVDHIGDAFSRLPDGRVVVPSEEPPFAGPKDFADDIRFVLDHVRDLAELDLDLGRVGMFGWSKGGTATALVMLADRRVRAGLSLDGPMQPLITTDLDRPFMLMTAEFTRAAEPSVAQFWSHLRGRRLDVRADGVRHSSYTDYQILFPQLAAAVGMSGDELRERVGTLPAARATRIQQAYPLAFFDRHLRHRPAPLLDGPSPAFPEVRFLG